MQEVPASGYLLLVQGRHEVQVHDCCDLRSSHPGLVCRPVLVQVLPSGKLSAHGRSHQEIGLLFAELPAGLGALLGDAEVPWHPVIRVEYRDIERETGHDMLGAKLSDQLGDPWRRVDLGDDFPRRRSPLTASLLAGSAHLREKQLGHKVVEAGLEAAQVVG